MIAHRTPVVDAAGDGPRIRVHEQFRGIVAQPGGRIPFTVDAVAVALPGPHVQNPRIPTALQHRHGEGPLMHVGIQQYQLDGLRARRGQAELATLASQMRARQARGSSRHIGLLTRLLSAALCASGCQSTTLGARCYSVKPE